MSALVIDARVQFGLARMKASAQRAALADGAAQTAVDVEFLDAELRAAMSTGGGFGHDMDGRPIE